MYKFTSIAESGNEIAAIVNGLHSRINNILANLAIRHQPLPSAVPSALQSCRAYLYCVVWPSLKAGRIWTDNFNSKGGGFYKFIDPQAEENHRLLHNGSTPC